MLSCSLDQDQDLQSGSKLFTWYDVCCNIRGGGLCPSCKIQRGGLCPSCKIQQGGLCPSYKIYGGDFVHVYKNEQGGGGFVRGGGGGGFCPTLVTRPYLVKQMNKEYSICLKKGAFKIGEVTVVKLLYAILSLY